MVTENEDQGNSIDYLDLAPCKVIQDSIRFWIPSGGFRIPDAGFRILPVQIPDSKT